MLIASKQPSCNSLASMGISHYPWKRLHVDFADRSRVGCGWWSHQDAFKVARSRKVKIGSTTTKLTISILRQLFARFGLPKQKFPKRELNSRQVTSKFYKQYSILHTPNPAYHPSSNGQAERFVQTFKKGIRKGMDEDHADLDDIVKRFLALYRNTEYHTTGESPAKLLLGRNLSGPLDIPLPPSTCLPSVEIKVKKSQKKLKTYHNQTSKLCQPFHLEDHVLVCQPESPDKGYWKPATVTTVLLNNGTWCNAMTEREQGRYT